MHIEEEVKRIRERIGRNPNNLTQFIENRQSIISIKEKIKKEFGYEPRLSEAIFLLKTGLSQPEKCKKEGCKNLAFFSDEKYGYCSRKCARTDENLNRLIQSKRLPKINYSKINKKTAETKNQKGEDGLTGHQRSSIKTMATRNQNYENWYQKLTESQKNRSPESKNLSVKKRRDTLFERYGITHTGGGYSKLKKMVIEEKIFFYQGYEDVVIYDLIYNQNVDVCDIECCVRYKNHSFNYKDNLLYIPDLFIISEKKYIEVKSPYWDSKDFDKILKKRCVIEKGFNYERIIIDDKKWVQRIRRKIKESNLYIGE